MIDYNTILESIEIRINKFKSVSFLKATTVKDFNSSFNTLIINRRGWLLHEQDNLEVAPGEYLFIPAGTNAKVSFVGKTGQQISMNEFNNGKNKHFINVKTDESALLSSNHFLILTFESKVLDTIDFFDSLTIPTFKISNAERAEELINYAWREKSEKKPGYSRTTNSYCELMLVELIRHLMVESIFVQQFVTYAEYFKDPRLLSIFRFIKQNITGDLSNKALADVANVSEDYVGQYFKGLTGMNPQDYVEFHRLQHAIDLLRNTKKSIREVGKEAGYKDTAYFCRRFKMMYGIPAAKLRKREIKAKTVA